MLKAISQKQAAEFMATLAKSKTGARRVYDSPEGLGLHASQAVGKVNADHATYFIFDDCRGYYSDPDKISGVFNDRGDLERVIYHYPSHIAIYEKA